MADDTQNVLCGTCRIPVKGPADPKPQDVFSCPDCGNSDTLENLLACAKAFVYELAQRHLQEAARNAARGSKFIKFEGKPIPQKTHRFITDDLPLNFHPAVTGARLVFTPIGAG